MAAGLGGFTDAATVYGPHANERRCGQAGHGRLEPGPQGGKARIPDAVGLDLRGQRIDFLL